MKFGDVLRLTDEAVLALSPRDRVKHAKQRVVVLLGSDLRGDETTYMGVNASPGKIVTKNVWGMTEVVNATQD